MSKKYRELTGEDTPRITTPLMQIHCLRPGEMDDDGLPIYMTQQSDKESCDINQIIQKYDKNGILDHVNKLEASYGDITGLDYQKSLNLAIKVQEEFDMMPSKIRNRFDNDPGKYLEFMEDTNNRDEAISLGLVSPYSDPLQDGIGEHIKEGQKTKDGKKAKAESAE